MSGSLFRIAAFTTSSDGGNPAGVWVGEKLPASDEMQKIAAEVGYSETAFIAPLSGYQRTARYYSPIAEVSFCGHATIAAGAVLGELAGDGVYRLSTAIGEVPVTVRRANDIQEASLTSVDPKFELASKQLVAETLAHLSWKREELDSAIPPAKAYAGAWHLVLAAKTQKRLQDLSYNFEGLKKLMLLHHLTTLQLIWRKSEREYYSRNPFPVGGVVEDPATGAAAAALGGYLRESGLIKAPMSLQIFQGEEMGRPSQITVTIPLKGGIEVSGSAVKIVLAENGE